jgi:hypothetical protein
MRERDRKICLEPLDVATTGVCNLQVLNFVRSGRESASFSVASLVCLRLIRKCPQNSFTSASIIGRKQGLSLKKYIQTHWRITPLAGGLFLVDPLPNLAWNLPCTLITDLSPIGSVQLSAFEKTSCYLNEKFGFRSCTFQFISNITVKWPAFHPFTAYLCEGKIFQQRL